MNKIALVGCITLLAACGADRASAPPPAAPPTGNAAEAGSARAASRPAAPSSGAPRYLGGLRLSHPETTLRAALAAFPQYLPPMARDLRGVVEIGVGKVGDIVALDRPMELRFFERTQKPAMILTATVRDDVDVRAALGRFRVTEASDGRLDVAPPNPFSADLALSKECEVEMSAKPRTVSCSSVQGFLTRTRTQRTPRPASNDDITAEMSGDLVKEQAKKDAALESPAKRADESDGEAAGRALAQTFLKGFVDDLRSLELGASLSQDTVSAGLTLDWLDGRSTFARVLGSGTAPAAPPARFFHLPVDSDSAFFSLGVEASAWEPIKKGFVEAALADATSKAEYPEPIVTEARKWLNQLFFTGGGWMLAMGRRTSEIRDVLKNPAVGRMSSDERKIAFERAGKEWFIFEIDEAGEGVVAKAKNLYEFTKRADLAAKSKERGSSGKSSSKSDEDLRRWKTEIAPAPRPLPTTTFHFVGRSMRTDQPKNQKLARSHHVLVVPEGDHTWIGVGEDEKTIVEHLKRVLEGQPASGTLAARRGIEGLGKTPLVAGGFASLSLFLGFGEDWAKDEPTVLKEKLDYLSTIPSKGLAPYFFALRRGADASPRLTVELKSSTRTLDEIIGYVQRFDK
jgi:hypothetical protein